MISIEEFNRWSKFDKCVYLWQNGTFVSNRYQENGYVINLYFTNGFYAEVWYNGNHHRVGSIRTFNSPLLLEPYLEIINIEDVYL